MEQTLGRTETIPPRRGRSKPATCEQTRDGQSSAARAARAGSVMTSVEVKLSGPVPGISDRLHPRSVADSSEGSDRCQGRFVTLAARFSLISLETHGVRSLDAQRFKAARIDGNPPQEITVVRGRRTRRAAPVIRKSQGCRPRCAGVRFRGSADSTSARMVAGAGASRCRVSRFHLEVSARGMGDREDCRDSDENRATATTRPGFVHEAGSASLTKPPVVIGRVAVGTDAEVRTARRNRIGCWGRSRSRSGRHSRGGRRRCIPLEARPPRRGGGASRRPRRGSAGRARGRRRA